MATREDDVKLAILQQHTKQTARCSHYYLDLWLFDLRTGLWVITWHMPTFRKFSFPIHVFLLHRTYRWQTDKQTAYNPYYNEDPLLIIVLNDVKALKIFLWYSRWGQRQQLMLILPRSQLQHVTFIKCPLRYS